MAAYFQGRRLNEMAVQNAMASPVVTCGLQDDVAAAEGKMQAKKVRRLPVVDDQGSLVGILSLNDIACEGERERRRKTKRQVTADEIAATLGAVCGHRGARDLVVAA
jgi:CBS-domain-containing membrane protein